MISGMRKPSPISISSPRETITSPPRAKGREGEQHSGGAIIHDDSGLGAGEALQQSSSVNVAFAAGPSVQVVLQVGVLRGGATQVFD